MNSSSFDITTLSSSSCNDENSSILLNNIKTLLNENNLLPLKTIKDSPAIVAIDELKMLSSDAFQKRKESKSFLVFINNRLVEFPRLKKTIISVYSKHVLKEYSNAGAPFVYISIQIHPSLIDFNVSPDKSTVVFAREDEVLQWISDIYRNILIESSDKKTFHISKTPPTATTIMSAISCQRPFIKNSSNLPTIHSDPNSQSCTTLFSNYSLKKKIPKIDFEFKKNQRNILSAMNYKSNSINLNDANNNNNSNCIHKENNNNNSNYEPKDCDTFHNGFDNNNNGNGKQIDNNDNKEAIELLHGIQSDNSHSHFNELLIRNHVFVGAVKHMCLLQYQSSLYMIKFEDLL